MVSRALGPKREGGSVLMFFPAQGEQYSVSASAAKCSFGVSWIQSGAVGASAGLAEGFNDCGTEQSSSQCKFQQASFGLGCFFI